MILLFRLKECPHPLADVKVTAIILRILTKDSWDEDDLRLFDACWRQAAASELFGDEFEAERLRIQHCVETCRKQVAPRQHVRSPIDLVCRRFRRNH